MHLGPQRIKHEGNQIVAVIAELYDHVVGVDTHARQHTLTVVECRTGTARSSADFPTTSAGLARALSWISRHGEVARTFAAVEGTSSYGATFTRLLLQSGFAVGEVRPPTKAAQSRNGKSDKIDAEAAARWAMSRQSDEVPIPRADGERAALRVLLASRSLQDQQRTANRNALTALLRTVDLGVDVRKPLSNKQIQQIFAWRSMRNASADVRVAHDEARRLATAIIKADEALLQNQAELAKHAEAIAPTLQDEPGVGPVTAAIIICAYSHHGRVRSEAAFAALGGVAPQPASSGNTHRHRLNRSGDRQLNRAFDVIARTRMSFDPKTRAYVERSRAAGKSGRETRRCLKRYICRQIYRRIDSIMT